MQALLPCSRAGRIAVSLALQGGGAHGAFTWSVADRLLEETIDIAAVSGTSAGAINAVALASGWCQVGRAGARATLDRLWRAVGREAAHSPLSHGGFAALALGLATHLLSPYELNPLDINPLRQLLDALVDFAALRAGSPMPILVVATRSAPAKVASSASMSSPPTWCWPRLACRRCTMRSRSTARPIGTAATPAMRRSLSLPNRLYQPLKARLS